MKNHWLNCEIDQPDWLNFDPTRFKHIWFREGLNQVVHAKRKYGKKKKKKKKN